MIDAVVDISHHNGGSMDFNRAKRTGLLGIIHKASQGIGGGDPMLVANRPKIEAAGLLFGTYHFATGDDPVRQADNLVDRSKDVKLLVLDFEPNPTGTSMSLDQAKAFVTRVFERTGRWPGLYSGHWIKQLLGNNEDAVLKNCWLWLAQFGPSAVVPHNWPTWTMWQYTDQGNVDGIGRCDRDRFNGDEAGLRRLWGV